jgi:SAM-dependent methyltransferase
MLRVQASLTLISFVLPHVVDRLIALDLTYLLYLLRIRRHRLDFTAATVSQGHDHMGSGGPDLSRVLNRLGIPPHSRILDLGSGKGAACLTLATHGFEEVVGLELCPALIQIAHANTQRVGASVRYVCGDAATFTDLDRFTHLYLFNPFPVSVLLHVWANVYESLERCPRRLTVIYKFPGEPPADLDPSVFTRRVIRLPRSHPFYIYEH